MIRRRKSRVIKIGNVYIGGNHPIAIQSMAKARTCDTENTIKQIRELKDAGCDIARLAVKDAFDARAIKKIKKQAVLPLVADIHFDWRLALEAIDNGADKIRLNPGNIHKKEQIRQIAKAAKAAGIPIRVGLNSGSLPGAGGSTTSFDRLRTSLTIGTERSRSAAPRKPGTGRIADRMVKDALDYVKILEGSGFGSIVISLKASSVLDTIEAYRKMGRVCDYPLHLGVTAAGAPFPGAIKSGIAIGALLLEGLGDTVRVSLTEDPLEEVKAAKCILEALNLRHFGPEIISCPTCGRCEVDLVKIVKRLEDRLAGQPVSRSAGSTGQQANRPTGKPIKVAVMGCVVNGPGEAKEADIGIAFGKKDGLLFRKGKAVRKVSFEDCADVLLEEMDICSGQKLLYPH